MKKYLVFIDLADDWNDEDIEIAETTVKAKNAGEAYETACKSAEIGHYDYIIGDKEYYIWDVTEDDRIA